jgi:hypothetical protein
VVFEKLRAVFLRRGVQATRRRFEDVFPRAGAAKLRKGGNRRVIGTYHFSQNAKAASRSLKNVPRGQAREIVAKSEAAGPSRSEKLRRGHANEELDNEVRTWPE